MPTREECIESVRLAKEGMPHYPLGFCKSVGAYIHYNLNFPNLWVRQAQPNFKGWTFKIGDLWEGNIPWRATNIADEEWWECPREIDLCDVGYMGMWRVRHGDQIAYCVIPEIRTGFCDPGGEIAVTDLLRPGWNQKEVDEMVSTSYRKLLEFIGEFPI